MTRSLLRTFALVALITAAAHAQYRAPVFICGGESTGGPAIASGLWILDGQQRIATPLFPSQMTSWEIYATTWDFDNRSLMIVADSTPFGTFSIQGGIFRYDPQTGTAQTVLTATFQGGPNRPLYRQHGILVNQDGDYVFGNTSLTNTSTDYHLLKLDASRTVTTLMSSTWLGSGARASFTGALGIDIDTGNYLVVAQSGYTTGPLGPCAMIMIDPHVTGKWSTFSNGPAASGYRGLLQSSGDLEQDYRTRTIYSMQTGNLHALRPGSTSATTVRTFYAPQSCWWMSPSRMDLQSAPTQRFYAPCIYFSRPTSLTQFRAPGLARIEPGATQPTRFVNLDPNRIGPAYSATTWPATFRFWRDRNIQTVKTGPKQWRIHLSCPSYPGRGYVAVVGASGVRPGVPLPDGRTVWINLDPVVQLSLGNRLRPFFDPGPGQLTFHGEAAGSIDLRSLPPTGGVPIWIAAAVLDPLAPGGVAFIPDTFVFRLP